MIVKRERKTTTATVTAVGDWGGGESDVIVKRRGSVAVCATVGGQTRKGGRRGRAVRESQGGEWKTRRTTRRNYRLINMRPFNVFITTCGVVYAFMCVYIYKDAYYTYIYVNNIHIIIRLPVATKVQRRRKSESDRGGKTDV